MAMPINLKKHIDGSVLEGICIAAAESLGFKTDPRDVYSKEYNLCPFYPNSHYDETIVRVRGRLFPAFEIVGIHKRRQQDQFFIRTGFPFGYAGKGKVKAYLNAVSSRIKQHINQTSEI